MKIKAYGLIFCILFLSVWLCACTAEPVALPGEAYQEIHVENGIVQRYFVIESEGCRLNAVYTYISDGKHHPTVLLIAGSGPSDYNGTVGVWRPYEDIALGLAERGVCSLRLDKRTQNGSAFAPTDGIEEEYLTDCRAALACLEAAGIRDIYLFGHSLGGQIAAELAVQEPSVKGMILFNSSPRHLADIACDQYTRADDAHATEYRFYADAAKASTAENAQGYYYYGVTDYYWAAYNALNTVSSIRQAAIPTLIVNSTADLQTFPADLDGWQSLTDAPNVTVSLYDEISHFGYRADLSDPSVIETDLAFPEELLDQFAKFYKEAS
ncbi:MAG: alpha/beta fold hydrolase [Clostridia bacterium]|nr:alpha/beta fold hydrolase [Clostridia bacterium]